MKNIFTLILVLFIVSCSSDSTQDISQESTDLPFEDQLLGRWSSGCLTGWIGTITFVNYQDATDTEEEYSTDDCTGSTAWTFAGAFTYTLGNPFLTEDNLEVVELDILYDSGLMFYTLVYIDENGTLYLGEGSGANYGDTPATRRTEIQYRIPWYRD